MTSFQKAFINMGTFDKVSKSLYIGDYKTAQNNRILQSLGITHVVSCGFNEGYFLDEFKYFCIDINDTPTSLLLPFLPRAVKFIKMAIESGGIVYVHCVHGQSRSCAVCIAYLMSMHIENLQESIRDEDDLLSKYYEKVINARKCMAINPGFMKQLEFYKRMKLTQREENIPRSDHMKGLSKSRATFRLFRAHLEFFLQGKISTFMSIDSDKSEKVVHCAKCSEVLCVDENLPFMLSDDEITSLPSSEYWINSCGGVEYINSMSRSSPNFNQLLMKVISNNEGIVIEPMEWMRESLNVAMINGEIFNVKGNLPCPSCSRVLGLYDWSQKDTLTSLLLMKSKIELRVKR